MHDPHDAPTQFAPSLNDHIGQSVLTALLRVARDEDLGTRGDLTSRLLIPEHACSAAAFRARQPGRLAGAAVLEHLAPVFDQRLTINDAMPDGSEVNPGDTIATVAGPLCGILAMERVALNLLGHLSGVATLTARFVQAVGDHPARICATRKTLPGLRRLQKYAVVCGGADPHRLGLFDAVLIKDNHLAHLVGTDLAVALRQAVHDARDQTPPPRFVQVEVDRLDQLDAALDAGPDMILLDNMDLATLAQAVQRRNERAAAVQLEASGGVGLDTVHAIAATGVDRISVGALTHSAPALDIGLDRIDPAPGGDAP